MEPHLLHLQHFIQRFEFFLHIPTRYVMGNMFHPFISLDNGLFFLLYSFFIDFNFRCREIKVFLFYLTWAIGIYIFWKCFLFSFGWEGEKVRRWEAAYIIHGIWAFLLRRKTNNQIKFLINVLQMLISVSTTSTYVEAW